MNVHSAGGSTKRATQLYGSDGSHITSVTTLQPDSDVFLSFGEEFSKPAATNYIDISYLGVMSYQVPRVDTVLVVKQGLEEISRPAKDYRIVTGIPSSYTPSTALTKMKQDELLTSVTELQSNQIFSDNCLLQHKTRPQLLLYPRLLSNPRTPPTSPQIWVYTRAGELRPKALPKLALVVSDRLVVVKHGNQVIEGRMVVLGRGGNWSCSNTGNFICQKTG